MRFYFLFFSFIILFSACKTAQTTNQQQTDIYIPATLKPILLGTSMDEVLKARPKAYPVNSIQETPRIVYTEELNTDMYNEVHYLFTKTTPKKLVEINLVHKDADMAYKTIQQFFGTQRNEKQNEWQKTLKDGTIVYATWRKKKVFVFIKTEEAEKAPEQ